MRWWLAGLLVLGMGAGGQAEDHAQRLQDVLRDSWEGDLEEDPLFAMRVGERRGAGRLPRVGLQAQQQSLARRRQLLARAEQIDAGQLDRGDRINLDIFLRTLRNAVREGELHTHLIPITNREGFHVEFPQLPQLSPLQTVADYESYISRLAAFGDYADEHIELMREGIRCGMVLPGVVLDGVERAIEPHVVERAEASLLYGPLREFPETIGPGDQQRLRQAAAAAIRDSVAPGFERFLKFMQQEYLPAARGSIAAAALPQGRDLYRHRVQLYTTLDISPEAVHEIGLREVRRIRQEMEAVPAQVGFEGSYAEFLQHLRTSPQFYPQTADELLKEVSYALKRMDGQLPTLFGRLPRIPYGIREVPDYIAPRTTTAYYMPPPGDGRQAGFYYVNTYNLKSRPLFEVEALSLHEAVPGHHLQLSLQLELEDLPPFRRFAEVTVFVEGWALYAERLGLEAGFYQDPYSNFGRLSFEMWRACRLVVDTGMHYLGWSRQQAIDFMADNTALSIHNIHAEVDRYIAWPGQALAYKTGELKIRELRALAEQELGDEFDIRRFHDVVLADGAVPLTILEENVRQYIERESAGSEGVPRNTK